MNTAEENALKIYIKKLEAENEKMRAMSTRQGFYNCYFIELKTAKSNEAAFNKINEEYYALFKHYRYSDWNSFKKMTNYYNKKK